jgi:hypothetical protein
MVKAIRWTPEQFEAFEAKKKAAKETAAAPPARVQEKPKLTLVAEPEKKSKYRNKVKVDETTGERFDSMAEYARYQKLKWMEEVGMIQNLRRQVSYELIPAMTICGKKLRPIYYVADFVYERNGVVRVEDLKGFKTPVYQIKRRLMFLIHGIEVHES